MISKEILNKYNMGPYEEYEEMIGDSIEADLTFYQTFLCQTDYIPNKIFETLIEELSGASLVDFIEVFLKFIRSIRVDYKEVLQARKIAREKVDEAKTELDARLNTPTE